MTIEKTIRSWIDFACDMNGCPEIKHKIVFEFNSRFTARLGDAKWIGADQGRIRLSLPLWNRASEKDRYETVLHEVCHLIAYFFARGKIIKPHGREWIDAMSCCGILSERTHNLDRKGLARKNVKMEVAECKNEVVKCVVSRGLLTQLKEDHDMCVTCKKCLKLINYHGLQEKEQ